MAGAFKSKLKGVTSYWKVIEVGEKRESVSSSGGKYEFLRMAVVAEGGSEVTEMTCPCRLGKQCSDLKGLPEKRYFAVLGHAASDGGDYHVGDDCKVSFVSVNLCI